MKPETVCCGCGRTIERAFIYCPWCGHLRAPVERAVHVDTIANHYDYAYYDAKTEHIENMEKRLAMLEKELDSLVLTANPELQF